MTREEGFYQVWLAGKPIIAEWRDEQWLLTGQYMRFNDDAFDQILERKIILPNERTTASGDTTIRAEEIE